jgi:hypothetical protein
MVKLGDRVRDKISGFEGIAAARTEYLNGCVRITVEPEGLHDGKPVEAQWFDEQQVDVIEAGAVTIVGRDAKRSEVTALVQVLEMGRESLSPDSYADLERIETELRAVRRAFKSDGPGGPQGRAVPSKLRR